MSDNRIYLKEGSVVDTYGGDYTYMDLWCVRNEEGGFTFFQQYSGAKPSEVEEITDVEEIEHLCDLYRNTIFKKFYDK